MVSVTTSVPEVDHLKKRKRDDTPTKPNNHRIPTEWLPENIDTSIRILPPALTILPLTIDGKKRSFSAQKTKRRRSSASSNVPLVTSTSLPNTPYASPQVYSPATFRSPGVASGKPNRCHVCLRAAGPTFQISQCDICEKGMCQVCTRECIVCDQLRCSKCCIET